MDLYGFIWILKKASKKEAKNGKNAKKWLQKFKYFKNHKKLKISCLRNRLSNLQRLSPWNSLIASQFDYSYQRMFPRLNPYYLLSYEIFIFIIISHLKNRKIFLIFLKKRAWHCAANRRWYAHNQKRTFPPSMVLERQRHSPRFKFHHHQPKERQKYEK